jgi:hypothetical protein
MYLEISEYWPAELLRAKVAILPTMFSLKIYTRFNYGRISIEPYESELKSTLQLGFPEESNFSASCRVVLQLVQSTICI